MKTAVLVLFFATSVLGTYPPPVLDGGFVMSDRAIYGGTTYSVKRPIIKHSRHYHYTYPGLHHMNVGLRGFSRRNVGLAGSAVLHNTPFTVNTVNSFRAPVFASEGAIGLAGINSIIGQGPATFIGRRFETQQLNEVPVGELNFDPIAVGGFQTVDIQPNVFQSSPFLAASPGTVGTDGAFLARVNGGVTGAAMNFGPSQIAAFGADPVAGMGSGVNPNQFLTGQGLSTSGRFGFGETGVSRGILFGQDAGMSGGLINTGHGVFGQQFSVGQPHSFLDSF